MSADPEEEDVLLSEFETVLDTPPLRPDLDQMLAMDVQADLEMIGQPMVPAPTSPDAIEELFTQSMILQSQNVIFTKVTTDLWKLNLQGIEYNITFSLDKFEENPNLRLILPGDPIFEQICVIANSKALTIS